MIQFKGAIGCCPKWYLDDDSSILESLHVSEKMKVRPDGAQFDGTLLGNGLTGDDVSVFHHYGIMQD